MLLWAVSPFTKLHFLAVSQVILKAPEILLTTYLSFGANNISIELIESYLCAIGDV